MRILGHGFDTVHYHIAAGEADVLAAIDWCEESIERRREGVSASGKNGYRYQVVMPDGMRLFVPSAAGVHMGLYVVGGSAWCLRYEPAEYEHVIDGHIWRLGMRIDMALFRLRRVDIRFDVMGITPYISEFEVVTRAKYRASHWDGHDWTGFTAGKGDLVLRIYDKIREAKQAGTLDRWIDAWGGVTPDDEVWRFEYQLRGDVIGEFGIESMQDLIEREGDVMTYLLDWFRVAHVQARKDQDRPLVDWWARFHCAVMALPLAMIGAVRGVRPRLPDARRLVDQMVGLLASWSAARDVSDGLGGEFDYPAVLNDLIVYFDRLRPRMAARYREKLAVYKQAAFA